MENTAISSLNEEALYWHFLRAGYSEYVARKRAKRFLEIHQEFESDKAK